MKKEKSKYPFQAPKGFQASGVACGIKSKKEKDLCLLYSEHPCTAAATFTRNSFQGAHIPVCREHLRGGAIRAVIVNSGCANTCTRHEGIQDAKDMTATVAEKLDLAPEEVLVASTGLTGLRFGS